MMKIKIKETGKLESLSMIAPRTKVDCVVDFIGNNGGLDQFTYDADENVYTCDQETFDWWAKVVSEHEALDERVMDLREEYGSDRVFEVLNSAGDYDLEDMPAAYHKALDEAFAGN